MQERLIEVSPEDFKAILKQFAGHSGWKASNGRGSFNPVVHTHEGDDRRKFKYGSIVFVEKVDTVE